jgi:hypothetical protein
LGSFLAQFHPVTPTQEAPIAAPTPSSTAPADLSSESPAAERSAASAKRAPVEIGGREGPDPTRYGDWELRGRCIDF